MKKSQTRSKDIGEKSDYWKWNNRMCFNGVYCQKKNCEWDHPIVNGKELKGLTRRYTPECSKKGDDTTLNDFGHDLLMKYQNSCPGKTGKESREKFWNNYCDTLDNPLDIIHQGQKYQECADNREIYAKTCALLPDELDISHHKTGIVMNQYAKDCRNKVRAINFRNDKIKNKGKQTKRNVLDHLSTAKKKRLSDEKWGSMFKLPSTRSKSRSRTPSHGYRSPRKTRKTRKKTTRGPTGTKLKK